MPTKPTKPIPELTPRQFLSFRFRIDDGDDDECWNWEGSKTDEGYGHIKMHPHGDLKAHRIAFKLGNGFDPIGFEVAHQCDNPSCVNPRHLFKATGKENVQDSVRKGRQPCRKGIRHGRHKVSESDVAAIRSAYHSGLESQQQIANRYGVSQVQISHIVRRVAWSHI